MSWRRGQTAILTPSPSSTIAALLSHLGWGCSTVGHWGPKALCLPLALNSASCLQLTRTAPGTWLYYCLTHTCFCCSSAYLHRCILLIWFCMHSVCSFRYILANTFCFRALILVGFLLLHLEAIFTTSHCFLTANVSNGTLGLVLCLVGMHSVAASKWALTKFSYSSFGVGVSDISWSALNLFLSVNVYLSLISLLLSKDQS